MFDNHIQNIWVAQRKREEEKNNEIGGGSNKGGGERIEECGEEGDGEGGEEDAGIEGWKRKEEEQGTGSAVYRLSRMSQQNKQETKTEEMKW